MLILALDPPSAHWIEAHTTHNTQILGACSIGTFVYRIRCVYQPQKIAEDTMIAGDSSLIISLHDSITAFHYPSPPHDLMTWFHCSSPPHDFITHHLLMISLLITSDNQWPCEPHMDPDLRKALSWIDLILPIIEAETAVILGGSKHVWVSVGYQISYWRFWYLV